MMDWFKNLDISALTLQVKHATTFSRLIYGLNIALCGGLLWGAASFTARVIEHEFLDVPYSMARYTPPTPSTKDKARPYRDFEDITAYNIFDAEVTSAQETDSLDKAIVTSASLTSLVKSWMLTGVYTGPDAYCFIQNQQTKQEDIFGIGDPVFNTQVKIAKIITTGEAPKVYLKRGSEIAILEYQKDKTQNSLNYKSVKNTPTSSPNNADGKKYSTDGTLFHISSAEVDHHLNNFSKLLNQARVVPYFKNGKSAGYKIKAIDKGSLYEKLGLVNNDIIQEINGEAIDSPEKAFQLLKLLRNEREINISLTRGNTPKNLTYYIE